MECFLEIYKTRAVCVFVVVDVFLDEGVEDVDVVSADLMSGLGATQKRLFFLPVCNHATINHNFVEARHIKKYCTGNHLLC